jgi:hypothetical protein
MNFLKRLFMKKENNINFCDLCSAPTSKKEGTVYSAHEFRRLVSRGLEPDDATLSFPMKFGISKQMAIEQWKHQTVDSSTTDWLLCAVCAKRAERFK